MRWAWMWRSWRCERPGGSGCQACGTKWAHQMCAAPSCGECRIFVEHPIFYSHLYVGCRESRTDSTAAFLSKSVAAMNGNWSEAYVGRHETAAYAANCRRRRRHTTQKHPQVVDLIRRCESLSPANTGPQFARIAGFFLPFHANIDHSGCAACVVWRILRRYKRPAEHTDVAGFVWSKMLRMTRALADHGHFAA